MQQDPPPDIATVDITPMIARLTRPVIVIATVMLTIWLVGGLLSLALGLYLSQSSRPSHDDVTRDASQAGMTVVSYDDQGTESKYDDQYELQATCGAVVAISIEPFENDDWELSIVSQPGSRYDYSQYGFEAVDSEVCP